MRRIVLFVYGTLKRGQTRHALLAGQTFVREARTLPRYRLYHNGLYPCLVEDAEHGLMVEGELWSVSEDALPSLDAYEGAPDLYARRPAAVEGAADVFAYLYNGPLSELTDCGGSWPPR